MFDLDHHTQHRHTHTDTDSDKHTHTHTYMIHLGCHNIIGFSENNSHPSPLQKNEQMKGFRLALKTPTNPTGSSLFFESMHKTTNLLYCARMNCASLSIACAFVVEPNRFIHRYFSLHSIRMVNHHWHLDTASQPPTHSRHIEVQ